MKSLQSTVSSDLWLIEQKKTTLQKVIGTEKPGLPRPGPGLGSSNPRETSFINAFLRRNLCRPFSSLLPPLQGKEKDQKKPFQAENAFPQKSRAEGVSQEILWGLCGCGWFCARNEMFISMKAMRPWENPGWRETVPEWEWNCNQVGIIDPPGAWQSQKQSGVEIWGVN